jgi:tetratricopeptide (TPR) repeat protein
MEPAELARAVHNGALDDAARKLEDERAAAVRRGDSRASAVAANDLGVVYYLSGQREQARKALAGSLDDFTRLGDRSGKARALGNLARVEESSRNRAAALAMYQQAAELFHEGNERSDEFATLRSLSQLYLRMGGWLQALATYDRGLTVKPNRTWFDMILHWLYQIPLRMIGMTPL